MRTVTTTLLFLRRGCFKLLVSEPVCKMVNFDTIQDTMRWQTAPSIKHASQLNLPALAVELTLLEDARALSQLQAVQCKYVSNP